MSDVPQTCGTCLRHTQSGECRRHSPSPNHEEPDLLVFWNKTKDDQRCSGYSDKKPWIQCGFCADWWRPEGGLNPLYKMGLPDEWWENAGYCTQSAPGTNNRESRDTYWGITHGVLGGCADGTDTKEVAPP